MSMDRKDLLIKDGVTPPSEVERQVRSEPVINAPIWAILSWGLIVMIASVPLARLTSYWWLSLVFGLAVPAICWMVVTTITAKTVAPSDAKARPERVEDKQQQLLHALFKSGELTPTTAALQTALTAEEAAKTLDEFASEGYLEVTKRDGVNVYALHDHGRRNGAKAEDDSSTAPNKVPPLAEPLTERELEVLQLLASGRTNAEVAGDLFVATGTVKAHANNIYRKLDARNRTEALARAKDLELI